VAFVPAIIYALVIIREGGKMLVKKIFSKEIIDSQGDRVGKIVDMDVDMSKGTINHVILSTGVFAKREMKLDKIKNIGDTIILNVKKDEI
jgi:sporulation protein YlmC with PRC-barrel domain